MYILCLAVSAFNYKSSLAPVYNMAGMQHTERWLAVFNEPALLQVSAGPPKASKAGSVGLLKHAMSEINLVSQTANICSTAQKQLIHQMSFSAKFLIKVSIFHESFPS